MIPIVSYIQDAFQEYEGETSLVLFCFGCNLSCSYCYNKEIVSNKDNIIGNAYEVIDKLLRPNHTAVVLLGGEITIYPVEEVRELVKHIKKLGRKVKIYTNGQSPATLRGLYGYVDAISLDVKTSREDVTGIPIVEYLANLYETLVDIKRYFACKRPSMMGVMEGDGEGELELRTTIFEGMLEEDIENIEELAKSLEVKLILQPVIGTNP